MAAFIISGIWKNNDNVTHYAIHRVTLEGISNAEKISKEEAILLVGAKANSVVTWIWNYKRGIWDVGQNVEVSNTTDKYLKTNP